MANMHFVITSVNDNPKYTKFIPLFVRCWLKLYPTIKPIIIYVGPTPLDPTHNEFEEYIITLNLDKTMNSVFASQMARILYPCMMDPESVILVSDIDMIPGNSSYFDITVGDPSLRERGIKDAFTCFRSLPNNGQMTMCYNLATASVWKDIFKINDVGDINTFLLKYKSDQFDGNHGGVGWTTDQKLLFDYVMSWKASGGNVVFLTDELTGYNRLPNSHLYATSTFKRIVNSQRFSDCHLYAAECFWSREEIYMLSLDLFQTDPEVNKLKIAVCIPCHSYYASFIDRVLESMKNQTRLPDLVVISMSEIIFKDDSITGYPFKIVCISTPERKNMAENRNAAAKCVPSEFNVISFFDVDDYMHPKRLEIIEKTFFQTNADIFLHDYTYIDYQEKTDDYWKTFVQTINPLDEQYIVSENWHRIHNGHVTVRKSTFDISSFDERNEYYYSSDVVYLDEAKIKGYKLFYCEAILCLYLYRCPPQH